uniref:Uncharacterized protein n=1 Tax=Zea mays TaxID=4577 RepID=C4J7V5_MAIZE|nr:unknown [Zea mays]
MDSLRGPTLLLLLQNLRSGMSANGSSNDSTICTQQTIKHSRTRLPAVRTGQTASSCLQ